MPNVVNQMLVKELEEEVSSMGSCLVIEFDKLTVAQAQDVRKQFRDAGLSYRVVRNRLARRVFADRQLDLAASLKGKCGIVFADEENAIGAAKLVRDFSRSLKTKHEPLRVTGAVIEGEVIGVDRAATVADMPDRQTVRAQLAMAIAGPARALATVTSAVGGGLARCLQAKVDKEGDAA